MQRNKQFEVTKSKLDKARGQGVNNSSGTLA